MRKLRKYREQDYQYVCVLHIDNVLFSYTPAVVFAIIQIEHITPLRNIIDFPTHVSRSIQREIILL